MKKYKGVEFKGFWWIVLPILVFVWFVNATYAYFTATASSEAGFKTGIVNIALNNVAYAEPITQSFETTLDNIVPGETLKFTGTVQNTGNVSVYYIMEFFIGTQTVTFETYYFTINSGKVARLPSSSASPDFLIAEDSESFTISYILPTSIGDSYKDTSIDVKIVAHAIQAQNITASDALTELLG